MTKISSIICTWDIACISRTVIFQWNDMKYLKLNLTITHKIGHIQHRKDESPTGC